jgi:hypothetical protein
MDFLIFWALLAISSYYLQAFVANQGYQPKNKALKKLCRKPEASPYEDIIPKYIFII